MCIRDRFLRIIVTLAAAITVAVLLFLVAYILVMGVPNLKPSLFELEYNSENASLLPALINTIIMTFLSLIVAVPVGIFSAIYLVEYARRGNKLVGVVRITAETLSGIPSIVYGLFGFLFFGVSFGWGYSMLGGALTMAIMILPLVMRTTEAVSYTHLTPEELLPRFSWDKLPQEDVVVPAGLFPGIG